MAMGDAEASAQGVCSADDRLRRFKGGGLTSGDDVEDIEGDWLRRCPEASCIDRPLGEIANPCQPLRSGVLVGVKTLAIIDQMSDGLCRNGVLALQNLTACTNEGWYKRRSLNINSAIRVCKDYDSFRGASMSEIVFGA